MIYPNLRQSIDTYITANGNKEITGTILNDLLNSMITALGANYQLAGVATPSTNPGEAEQAVMWFASQAGTYTNFGAIVLPLGIHLLKWDGTSWTSQTFFTVDNAPTEGSNNLISSDAVAQALKDVIDFIELELVDTTGSSSQATQMNVTLRSNQGTEEEPDYITLASIVFGAATNEKAGLLKAAFNKMLDGGFTYAGIATANASSISSPVDGTFYIGGAGNYTGYAGSAIEVALGQIVIMKRASSAWQSETITVFQVDDAPTSESAKLVKSGGTFNAIQNSPQLGYFRCNTAAATAAKTVASDNYILPTIGGGSIKIKMTNANTASNVTLKIGSADAKPLYYAGAAVSASNTWQDSETVEVYYDGTTYQANNVARGGGSGDGDGVYDISAAHEATYASLATALGTNGANVPADVRHGGMSIKFVNSVSGKYEQWRYMGTSVADADFVVVTNWQGVDDVPTAGSNNLIKSGGVNAITEQFEGVPSIYHQFTLSMTDGKYIGLNGEINNINGRIVSDLVDISEYSGCDIYVMFAGSWGNSLGYALYKADGTFISGKKKPDISNWTKIGITSDTKYVRVSSWSANINNIALYAMTDAEDSYQSLKAKVENHDAILKNTGVKTTTVWGDDDSHNFLTGVSGLDPSSFFIKLDPHFYTKLKSGVAANSSKNFIFYHYDNLVGRVIPFHNETLVNDTDAAAVIEKDIALDFSNEEQLSFTANIAYSAASAQYPGMPFWNGELGNLMTAEQWDAATYYSGGNFNLGFSMEYIVPSDYEDDSIIRTVHTSTFFKKKKYVAYGDSIMVTAGSNLNSPYLIPSLIGRYFDMVTVNRGASGSAPIASSNLSDANLAYIDENTMLVTISGGQNSWTTSEDINSTDRTNSIGAINYFIDKIREVSPKCVIVLCPTYIPANDANKGTCNADYKRIAENKGVGLAPTTDLSIINWEADRTPKVLRYDNVHPTEYGCIRFAAVCIKYLEQMIL